MALHLIESYDSENVVLIEGRTFPLSCLVEDDLGLRWFITSSAATIKGGDWIKAASAGAVALVKPRQDGQRDIYLAITTEHFIEHREERFTDYLYDGTWKVFEATFPGYGDLIAEDGFETLALTAEGEPQVAPPRQQSGFVHLHTHSEFSALDGLATMKEIVETVVINGDRAVGAADHGLCAGHADLQKACDAAGIRPVFAMEAYLVDDRHKRLDDFVLPEGMDEKSQEAKDLRAAYVAALKDYMHLVLIATDQEGLYNLWAMSTEAYRDGLYGKNARLDWETLRKFSKGVIATSACLRGPLVHHALLEGREDVALTRMARLLDIFGDRFYIELHTNHLEEQIRVNKDLVRIAQTYQVPVVAAVDAHYAKPEDKEAHRVWLSMQTNSDVEDESSLFAGGQEYHLKTEAEVRDALAYLGQDVVDEAVANTVVIAEQCTAEVRGEVTTPIYSAKGGHDADADKLLELCMEWWHKTLGKREGQAIYEARFEREFRLLVQKKFCGYFLMWAEICRWAKSNGILVGPGRGSGGGSLVAYLAGITDLDPVEADLLFERFMTEGRMSLPDFDVDFPQSKKQVVQEFVRQRFGPDYVTVVGSVHRLKNKGIIQKLSSALKSSLPDDYYLVQKEIAAIVDDAEGDTAGLGLSWEDLWAKAGDLLQPYREAQPYLFDMADRLVNRVDTYGQHAAGMLISTDEPLTGRLPLRRASEEGHLIGQFDKDVSEELGHVKFDMLTLRNLDTIQDTIDLIKANRGITIDVYSWNEEYLDPQVWEEIAEAHTLGIFQIETTLGTKYAKRMAPRSLADLADLVTVVRPGPRNSGLTETYIQRRDGLQEVTFPDPRLEAVLAKTYGCMLYQEDIMQACMVLGGYDSNEADEVRKILGKKKVEKVAAAGQEFISRSVERGMAQDAAEHLWAQMAEFAKYSFNRAHAFAYAVLGYWCAWLKFHYPVEFMTAALSSVDKKRIPEFVKESRRMGLSILPPDINESGSGFRAGSLAVRYGLDSLKGVGGAAGHIQAAQPFTSFEDFMTRVVEPTGSKVNRGHVALLARIGAFDNLTPNRRGLEQMLLNDKTGVSTRCALKTDGSKTFTWLSLDPKSKEETVISLPCSYDWENEPEPINPRTGKKMKRKQPPKKCTKACRQYVEPPPMVIEDVEPYTEADIREIEQEMLGVYLSSTPFDMVPPQEREFLAGQAEMVRADRAPEGLYLVVGALTSKRPYTTQGGISMGFISIETEVGAIDCAVFGSAWEKYRPDLHVGTFYLAEVERNSRGTNLYAIDAYTPQEN